MINGLDTCGKILRSKSRISIYQIQGKINTSNIFQKEAKISKHEALTRKKKKLLGQPMHGHLGHVMVMSHHSYYFCHYYYFICLFIYLFIFKIPSLNNFLKFRFPNLIFNFQTSNFYIHLFNLYHFGHYYYFIYLFIYFSNSFFE